MTMPTPSDRIEVGYVARAHGIRGELRVHLHNPEPTTLLSAPVVYVGGVRHQVARVRGTAGGLLVTLAGLADRDAAEALRGKPVEVDREAVEVGEGEFLVADLIGCAA